MTRVHVAGIPLDEEVVFIVSLLIFLMLTAQYFMVTDFAETYTPAVGQYLMQYISGIGAFLCALSIYVFYKLHIIEERQMMPAREYVPVTVAKAKRK